MAIGVPLPNFDNFINDCNNYKYGYRQQYRQHRPSNSFNNGGPLQRKRRADLFRLITRKNQMKVNNDEHQNNNVDVNNIDKNDTIRVISSFPIYVSTSPHSPPATI